MVRAKLDRLELGCAYATAEFFRDMLLLSTNAVVFYAKRTDAAACFQPEPTASKPKLEPDLAVALLEKRRR
ncbi:hypothetical protein GW17_00021433 [Ensete ventricosum]|nr:hypothetical protein GW17_00021433 [Ensete ventricosum]